MSLVIVIVIFTLCRNTHKIDLLLRVFQFILIQFVSGQKYAQLTPELRSRLPVNIKVGKDELGTEFKNGLTSTKKFF